MKFEHFRKCTPEMYLSDFCIPVNTPLGGGGGRQHRRLPRAANTLAPPLAGGHFWEYRHRFCVKRRGSVRIDFLEGS